MTSPTPSAIVEKPTPTNYLCPDCGSKMLFLGGSKDEKDIVSIVYHCQRCNTDWVRKFYSDIELQQIVNPKEAALKSTEQTYHHCPKHGLEICDGTEGADHGCSSNDRYGHVWSKQQEVDAAAKSKEEKAE